MEVIIGIWVLLIMLIIIFILKFKIKFDVINKLTEKHYIIWYTASKYHDRDYILIYTHFK